jgi:TolA-binding protein
MNRRIQILSILVALSTLAYAQTPMPVIVPANSDAQVQDAKAPSAPGTAASSAALDSAIQLLHQTQTVNEELLKTQETTLQQLDDLQKSAEQLKIFSKRG